MSLSRVVYLERRLKRAEGRHAQRCHRLLSRALDLTPERVRLMEPTALRELRQQLQDERTRWGILHAPDNVSRNARSRYAH